MLSIIMSSSNLIYGKIKACCLVWFSSFFHHRDRFVFLPDPISRCYVAGLAVKLCDGCGMNGYIAGVIVFRRLLLLERKESYVWETCCNFCSKQKENGTIFIFHFSYIKFSFLSNPSLSVTNWICNAINCFSIGIYLLYLFQTK